MPYQVALLNFEGPLDLLLQLIERSELEITQISLADVTEQYLEYIERLNRLDPEELNRFLELASRLVYIKSLALLPGTADRVDETEISELAEQLAEYRRYQKATEYLKRLLAEGRRSWSRPPEAAARDAVAAGELPAPPNLELEPLRRAFAAALAKLPPAATDATLGRTVSLTEMTERIRRWARPGRATGLGQLLRTAADRMEVLVLFLALLELVKSGHIRVSQSGQFDDIQLLSVAHTS
ncbi:segregation/condensation protein A [Candidatus Parcubacteria bacterium]|nr:segregation/condensation protein A [Candidatus Parcubacteria bacterium]